MTLQTATKEIKALQRESEKGLRQLSRRVRQSFRPPPTLTVSEWADRERQLSPESSAEPGQWYTARVPHLREIMDCFTDPRVKEIVWPGPTQVAKTEFGLNLIGFLVDQDPCPILYIMPTLDMARSWSRERLAPMIRDTKTLTNKVSDTKSRDSENATLSKAFNGGHLAIAGANSAASLASRPRRVLVCDEVDLYPVSAGTEGDPTTLAKKRLVTFWNSKAVYIGKYGDELTSRLKPMYKKSDQRKRYIPCPACGKFQILSWGQVKWEKGKPETAFYLCKFCDHHWNHIEKLKQLGKGVWKARKKFKGVAGFWLNGLYSPWLTWEQMVIDANDAEESIEKKKTWVTSFLAETWEEAGLVIEPKELAKNRENYGPKLPRGVLILTCGVDVQDDRIELEIVGWGEDEETWGIKYLQILGRPDLRSTWDALDNVLEQKFDHELGIQMTIPSVCIDSGGHFTQQVYKYCRTRQHRGIYAAKGIGTAGRPIINRSKKLRKKGVELLLIGTDAAKDLIYKRIGTEKPGPGFMHYTKSQGCNYDEEYFRQLTAEKAVLRHKNGFPYREWVKIRPRNEALDVRVYATAAFYRLNPNLNKYAGYVKKLSEQSRGEDGFTGSEPAQPKGTPPNKPLRNFRKPGGWVNKWKR
jgi:phage terminase large subunit GpA-like protein